jgi:RecB family exonuclease
VEDFPEYRGAIESCGTVTVLTADDLSLPPLQSTGAASVLYRYRGAATELGDLLERIMTLLEEGEDPGEIAITLPDRPEWRERLASEAGNRGLLLHFRSGDPLSGSVPGRFFRHLQETLSGDWELRQVQQLFTDCAVPWKEKELLHQLALFGRDHFCHRSGVLWEKQLRRSGNRPLHDYFIRLRKGAGLLTDAPTFTALKERIQPFIQTFLDSDRWGEGDLPTLQRSLDALKDLAEAEERCACSDTGPVFPLWLSWLESKKYVRSQERRGISVYDYRVSAGLNVKHHFIPGCGQEKSRILLPRFPFLSEEERTALSGSDRDLSEPFLRVYAGAGNGAIFSFSEEGFGGPDLPPTELIGLEEEGSSGERRDPFRLEASCWQSGVFTGKLWPLQKRGLTRYLSAGGAGKRSDFTAEAISSPQLREGIQKNLLASSSISPSMLSSFWSCPFAFLIDRGLKARAPEVNIRFDDPRIIGTLFHKVAARYFEKSGEGAQKNMEEALGEVFSEWSGGSDPIPLPPVAEAVQRSVSSGAMALAFQHPLVYGAYRTIGIEKELEADWEGKLKLSGRCDWIGRNSTEALVVDYKKRVREKKRDILPDDPESFPASFQIAFYRYLLKECGFGTASAALFDMTEGAFKTVCGDGKKPMLSDEEAEQLFTIVEEAITEMLNCFENGTFTVPQLRCEGCPVRGTCRQRFHVRDVKEQQEKQWS